MKRFISSILTVVLVFLYCSSFALSTSAQTDKTLDISNDIEALNDVSHCAEGEYDALNLDCGKRYFSNEENVVAIFDLKSDSGYTILDMYYDNENFVVISAAVSSEGNQIVFELLCLHLYHGLWVFNFFPLSLSIYFLPSLSLPLVNLF